MGRALTIMEVVALALRRKLGRSRSCGRHRGRRADLWLWQCIGADMVVVMVHHIALVVIVVMYLGDAFLSVMAVVM